MEEDVMGDTAVFSMEIMDPNKITKEIESQ